MSESTKLLELVQRNLDSFWQSTRVEFSGISEDLFPVIEYAEALMTGGKRFRALFCYWSWVAALSKSSVRQTDEQLMNSTEAMVGIASALEMFHGAALVHDDLLDQSDTRRGAPSVHKRFESLHTNKGWAGSPVRFGVAGSVLVGDLMLGWSSEIFGEALLKAPTPEVTAACRNEFSRMRVEVMAGQYLDVVEENAASTRPTSEAVGRANRVMLYKTAKYSIEAPLLIGAAFGGADVELLRQLSAFGIPLGMAFQLRDDVLGVFGDPAVTGKPAGDDLREGKRTVLVGLTREALNDSIAKIFDELLESRDLSSEQIGFLQRTIEGTGALEKTERQIEEFGNQALAALEALDVAEQPKNELRALALKVMNRDR